MSSTPRRTVRVDCVLFALLFVSAISLCPCGPARAASPQEVESAIQKAKQYLRSQQKPDGNWEPTAPRDDQQGGNTAMATYALLAAGDSPQDEHIKKAVAWLMNAKITGVYALGLRCQIWPYLKRGDPAVRAAVARDAEALLRSADKFGRWSYSTNVNKTSFFHNSTTQYGVLGLWACARAGYEVPTAFWKASEQGWLECQAPDGAWGYRSDRPGGRENAPTPTMTLAGLASLYIAQDYLHANEGARCTGNIANPHIDAGLKWITDHFDPKWDNGYLLYGVERTGVASGLKYFGTHDWYAIGAETLVRRQQRDGSWSYIAPGKINVPIPGTAYGLFFLTRGRAPVAMNKLQYAFELPRGKAKPGPKDVANWNQRPRDVANVVHWMGTTLERDLNWQVVNLSANAVDLLDAPLLYIAGDQPLQFNDEQKQKLRSYVEQGGIILGQADCAKAEFARSFKQLGGELFPAYEFRTLPSNHLVFTEQYPASKWKDKVEVEGLGNGARELMLLIPREDVAKSWQLQATAHKEHHFQLLSNIFLYAVDRSNLRYKGETHVITPREKVKPRRTIKVARVRYPGNWDPEPGGWRRMAAFLRNTFELGLDVTVVTPGGTSTPGTGAAAKPVNATAAAPTVLSLNGFDVAHLTGTGALRLSDETGKEIRRFVEAGGTLLVDAAGGNTPFADVAEQALAALFKPLVPDAAEQLARPAKPDHPVYQVSASKLTEVGYRTFARTQLGNSRAPRLRVIAIKGRPAVFYSREDLSTGLVGQSVDGIYGYDPKTATQLVANVILLATGEGARSPATKQTTAQPSTTPASTRPADRRPPRDPSPKS